MSSLNLRLINSYFKNYPSIFFKIIVKLYYYYSSYIKKNKYVKKIKIIKKNSYIKIYDSKETFYIKNFNYVYRYLNGLDYSALNTLENSYYFNTFKLKKKSLVLNIGANIGEIGYALYKKKMRVVMIEADKKFFHVLKKNFAWKKNCTLYNLCLSDKDGYQKFYEATEDNDSSLIKPIKYTKTYFIKTYKLDSIFKHERYDLIIGDLEGNELNFLLGAKKNLKKTKFLSLDLSEQKKKDDYLKVIFYLKKIGFRILNDPKKSIRGCLLAQNVYLK